MPTSPADRPTGLRERKKAKTRDAIQRHALLLFQRQGYAATTVHQIAEAAEVSQSTFFRYFPTKEDTVLYDPLDPFLIEAFVRQPAGLSPIAAVRAALQEILAHLPPDASAQEYERQHLLTSVPELRAALYSRLEESITMLAEAMATRTDRSADDFEVRVWSGAILGTVVAVYSTAAADPDTHFPARLDSALAILEGTG
jgi:AcrR family transcriptional regulator